MKAIPAHCHGSRHCCCALADDSNWYGGVNLGQSRAKIDDARITSGLLGSGLTTTTITDDSRDTGYKIFGGYQFNRNFALECGYFNLDKFGFVATTVPTGTLSGNIKLRGLNLDAVGFLPITEKFSAFGRVSVNYAQARDAFACACGRDRSTCAAGASTRELLD